MQKDPIITWRNTPHSPAVDAIINKRIAALNRFHSGIIGCRVVINAPHKRRVSGRGFDVRVTLEVPGPDIAVAHSVRQGEAADDVTRAVNAVFSAVENRLKEQKRQLGALEVKHHPPVLHGEIVEIEPALNYGFARADDGREVYFQKEGLQGDWDGLSVGDHLRFREMEGEKGPFAVDVAVVPERA